MNERMTRGLRMLLLLFGILGFAVDPAIAAHASAAIPAATVSVSVVDAQPTAAAWLVADPQPAVDDRSAGDTRPADVSGGVTAAGASGARSVMVAAVSGSAYATAASVSSGVVLAAKGGAPRARVATGVSSPAHTASAGPVVLAGRVAAGADRRLVGTVVDAVRAPGGTAPLTPRGRGPPSITGS
ncbi:hypothetical protein GCM10023195_61680 [Actinoallomurus liliacearum]|uniref:SAF domain-containing protein n=1 Tax=Actinoallomurus liliacearum TaxID=1080073 RepID=A0ABP8TU09_9ACTN